MSEKNLFPAELRVLLLAGAVGVMVTAGWLAAMAALMTAQGYSGAAAPPLATAAVGAGSLCSGWIADPVRQYWRIAGHGDPGEKAPQLNK